ANESNPGPRFALEPGTRIRSSMSAKRTADRVGCRVDLGNRAGQGPRAIRVLHAVPGENADHPPRVAQPTGVRALAQTGDGSGRRGLAEDAFTPRDEAVRVEDLVVGHGVDRAAGFVARCDGALPRGRVADAYRGGD